MEKLHGPHSDLTGKIDREMILQEEERSLSRPRRLRRPWVLSQCQLYQRPLSWHRTRSCHPRGRPELRQPVSRPVTQHFPALPYGMHLHHVSGQCRLCNATMDVLLALQQSACPGRFISG